MTSLQPLLPVVHLIGFALALGAATAKLVLGLKCRADATFVPVFLEVTRFLTRQIILGMILATLSGAAWLLMGYPFTPRLVLKIVLVAAVFALGPLIDNVVEPKVRAMAPAAGEPASPALARALKQFLTVEVIATLLLYAITVIWLLR